MLFSLKLTTFSHCLQQEQNWGLTRKKKTQHPFERLRRDGQAGNLPCAEIGDKGLGQEMSRDLVLWIAMARPEKRCWRWEEKNISTLT